MAQDPRLPWRATILTLFPEMFPGPLGVSLTGKGLTERLWQLDTVQIRDFATDKHRTVDDTPYGGGAGMVLKPDVVDQAIEHALQSQPGARLIYLSPRGVTFNQAKAKELVSAVEGVIILCGRYEGVDQRLIEKRMLEEISLGDYILTCGEMAAYALLDSCVRLIPGVIGKQESLENESFEIGLLEYPHYTRPQNWENKIVPDILLSGDHQKIAKWRQDQAETITKVRRPDLWQAYLNKNQ